MFISYSSADKPWARDLARALKQRGVSVWLDEEQLKPGENLFARIRDGLERSQNIVFLVGPGAARSNYVALELGMALGSARSKSKRIIPVVARDVTSDDIPGPIRVKRYLERHDPATTAGEIVETLAGCA